MCSPYNHPPSSEGCIYLFLCRCFVQLALGPLRVCPPIATSVTRVFPPPMRWLLYRFVQRLVDTHRRSWSCFRRHLPSSLASWTVWPYQVGQVVCFVCSFHLDCWCLTGCYIFSCLPFVEKKRLLPVTNSCAGRQHKKI